VSPLTSPSSTPPSTTPAPATPEPPSRPLMHCC
jgi:hypothetical protein